MISHHSWRLPPCPPPLTAATASMPHLCLLRVNDQPPLFKVATMPTTINNSNSTKASPLLAENPWLATTLQGRGTQKVNDAWWPPWPWGPSCTPAECSATGLSGSLTAAESNNQPSQAIKQPFNQSSGVCTQHKSIIKFWVLPSHKYYCYYEVWYNYNVSNNKQQQNWLCLTPKYYRRSYRIAILILICLHLKKEKEKKKEEEKNKRSPECLKLGTSASSCLSVSHNPFWEQAVSEAKKYPLPKNNNSKPPNHQRSNTTR